MRLLKSDFDGLLFTDLLFYHRMLKTREIDREKNTMRYCAFVTYSLGACPKKSFEAYLSSLGLADNREYMSKERKSAMAKMAHGNALRILDILKSGKTNAPNI